MGTWLDQVFWGFDSAVYQFVTEHVANPVLDVFFKTITRLGDVGWFWIVLSIVFLFFKKFRKCGVLMLVAIALGGLFTNIIIKDAVCRVRPYITHPEIGQLFHLIPPESSFSFPSGHATVSLAVGVTMFCYNKKWGSAGLILGLLIAFSRIYVYVHYPSDVVAGALVGLLCALMAYFVAGPLYDKIVQKIKEKKQSKSPA